MGFVYWYQGIVFVVIFWVLVGIPCYLIAVLGSKMINEMGNFPTRALEIQSRTFWKVFIVEFFALTFLALFFQVFY